MKMGENTESHKHLIIEVYRELIVLCIYQTMTWGHLC